EGEHLVSRHPTAGPAGEPVLLDGQGREPEVVAGREPLARQHQGDHPEQAERDPGRSTHRHRPPWNWPVAVPPPFCVVKLTNVRDPGTLDRPARRRGANRPGAGRVLPSRHSEGGPSWIGTSWSASSPGSGPG